MSQILFFTHDEGEKISRESRTNGSAELRDAALTVAWHNRSMSCSSREESCEQFELSLCEEQFHAEKCEEENKSIIENLSKRIREKNVLELQRAWNAMISWFKKEPIYKHFLDESRPPLEFDSKLHAMMDTFVPLVIHLLNSSTQYPLQDPFKGNETWGCKYRQQVTLGVSFILGKIHEKMFEGRAFRENPTQVLRKNLWKEMEQKLDEYIAFTTYQSRESFIAAKKAVTEEEEKWLQINEMNLEDVDELGL